MKNAQRCTVIFEKLKIRKYESRHKTAVAAQTIQTDREPHKRSKRGCSAKMYKKLVVPT